MAPKTEKTRILVIEDEPAIADTIRVALEKEGFAVRLESTGGTGLSFIEKNTVDLLILDVGLPDRSGFDVLRQIRSVSRIPVLLLTARAEEIDRVLGLELGADDYVVKPFSPRELAARVRAILRRYAVEKEGVARKERRTEASAGSEKTEDSRQQPANSGAFRVDSDRKLIYYFGKRLPLTPYEYGTLLLLLERPGWVYSRDKIMDHVWTEPEDSFDRAVDTVVKQLRLRLREVRPDLDPIETRRGMGYCLREDL